MFVRYVGHGPIIQRRLVAIRQATISPVSVSFPPKIGAPAARALAQAGITSAAELALWSDAELKALHGMGPKAIGILRSYVAEYDAPPSEITEELAGLEGAAR